MTISAQYYISTGFNSGALGLGVNVFLCFISVVILYLYCIVVVRIPVKSEQPRKIMSQTDETLADSSSTQTAKELFAGAAGGVAQVLIGAW